MAIQIRSISPCDHEGLGQVNELLSAEGIRMDAHLDYTCGIFDEDEQLIATGSCFQSTLRCLAVSHLHRGEALLNKLMAHLMEIQLNRGNTHLFVYTKPDIAPLLSDLGFTEISRVDNTLVFMENRRNGFSKFCSKLESQRIAAPKVASIVMNANPFTLGHQYLVERAARENDIVHLFVLSEDTGPIPFSVRRHLVEEGTSHLKNVKLHSSGPYMISSATFPSYFLKDQDTAVRTQAQLDLKLFEKIAHSLSISRRYAGREPLSRTTALYNETMAMCLPRLGIKFIELPRLELNGSVISATNVRTAIHNNELDRLREMLPESTYQFLTGPSGACICQAIRELPVEEIIHD